MFLINGYSALACCSSQRASEVKLVGCGATADAALGACSLRCFAGAASLAAVECLVPCARDLRCTCSGAEGWTNGAGGAALN